MIEKDMKRVVDGIKREILVEVDSGTNKFEFYENEELQMIIDIPEDVIHLEKAKFKRRKYAFIFDYYLDRGIQELSYKDIKSMINTQRIRCEVVFDFHNKNGIKIDIEAKDNPRFFERCFVASYLETINGVLFKFECTCDESFKYRELNELDKPDEIEMDSMWRRSIFHDVDWNENIEACAFIFINNISYSMPVAVYKKINSDEYLNNRNFFEEGGTLFDITKEQNRLLTKNRMLKKKDYNFIKYVEFDGSIII